MNWRALLGLCLCLLLASCASSANGASASPQRTVTAEAQPGSELPSPATQDLANLLQTEQVLLANPPRASNLYALTQELKTHTSGVPTRAGRKTPLNVHQGQESAFWVENQDSGAYSQLHARLTLITAHAYIYVQDSQPFNQAALQASAETFEQQIYPTVRAASGSEWTPGIDGDGHITILNVAGLGNDISGYFSAQDEYPALVNLYSNQREMFYVNLDGVTPGNAAYASVLANELQQLINWNEHPLTQDWANQGLALMAQHIASYAVNGVDQVFLKAPDTQLTDWSTFPGAEASHAGAAFLFMDYFIEHYGGTAILKELLLNPASPPANFDAVLEHHHFTDRFTDVLGKWLVANVIADPSIDNGEYGYPSIHIPALTPQHDISAYPLREADTVSQYGAEYYDLHPVGSKASTLSIQFTGSPTVRLVGTDPLDLAAEWWGNRADNMDSTLTHSFDLSRLKGRKVALQFETWFDLQQDHDYAYVEVSTDNGANWSTLKGNFTTRSNPAGLNWGNAYTGVSGGGAEPAWVQESVDLTPYAGQKIVVRFEEITDNALNSQGFAIDQISIPELNFVDNLSTTDGWLSKGFVYTNNILPERFLVQAIVYTNTRFTVQIMTIDLASAQGQLTLKNFGNQITRVVLIVSAYALDTMLRAHYQLTIRA